ncbi:MAG: hypothetical protein PWQ59_1419 [Thermoanaerobacterium sp.]|jgi:murein DD-endopeptidase MepM/ murein hydrolase activator NlpD|nr:hypothetical protein [Thermoanaerobacterium sp.]
MKKSITIFFTLLLFFAQSFGQSRIDDLAKQKQVLEKLINENNKQLELIQKSKKVTVNELRLRQNTLKLKIKIHDNIKSQINDINTKLSYTIHSIDSLTSSIENHKKQLIKLYKSYYRKINKSNTEILLFILSSNSFNQAFARLKFYKSLISYYNKLVQNLDNEKKNLENARENYVLLLKELRIKEIELRKTIDNIENEKRNLKIAIKKFESRRNELIREIKENKEKLDKIKGEIERIIRENRRKNESLSLEKRKYYKILTNKIVNNKGNLPKPAKECSVINQFGERPHPVLKYVKIQNNGLDLLLVNDYKVYCVEEGEVSKVFNIPYGGKAIIVRHGDYLSLYSNLSVVYVKPGNIVDSNTVLGKVLKQNDNTYILHFEIWNKTEPENPSNWINFDN